MTANATKRRTSAPAVEYVPTPADHMASALRMAELGVQTTRNALIRDMKSLIGTLEHGVRKLEAGRTLNGLGELQANGTMIDAACGTLAAQQEAYERLAALAAKLDLLPPLPGGDA